MVMGETTAKKVGDTPDVNDNLLKHSEYKKRYDEQFTWQQTEYLNANPKAWFDNLANSEWRKVNDILELQVYGALPNVAVDFRLNTIKGKKINLSNKCSLYFLVDVMSTSHHEISILLYILAANGMMYLPFDFQFNILDSSGCFLQSNVAGYQDKWMKQEITGKPGEDLLLHFNLMIVPQDSCLHFDA